MSLFGILVVIASIISLVVAYLFWIAETVGSEEIAVIKRFRKFNRMAKKGLNFPLKPFETIKRDSRHVIQLEISHKSDLDPGPPRVYANDDEEREDRIRVVFQNAENAIYWDDDGQKSRKWDELTKAEQERILKDPFNRRRVTAEFSIIIRLQIRERTKEDGTNTYFDFLENIGSKEAASTQIADTAVTTIRDQLARVTYGHANVHTDVFAKLGRRAVEILIGDIPDPTLQPGDEPVKNWGIDLLDLGIKSFELGHRLNGAQAELVAADFQAETIRQIAAAEGDRIRLEGAAKAEAEQLLLTARAIGTDDLAKMLDTDAGKLAAQLTTMQRALESSEHTLFLPTEFALLGGIKEALTKLPGGGNK